MCYHVGLPAFHIDTAVDAPPEVVLWFSLPRKYTETYKERKRWIHIAYECMNNNGCEHDGKSERINILGGKKERRKGQVSPHGNAEPHLPLPGQLPPHSGWSRCCMLPICTERPELTESPSAPWEKTRVKFEFSSWQKRKINKQVCVSVLHCYYLQQSGQWCGCSPQSWHQRGVFPPGLASSEPSVLASLKEKETHTYTQIHISGYTGLIWMIKEFPSFNPPNTSKLIHCLVRWSSSMSEALC